MVIVHRLLKNDVVEKLEMDACPLFTHCPHGKEAVIEEILDWRPSTTSPTARRSWIRAGR